MLKIRESNKGLFLGVLFSLSLLGCEKLFPKTSPSDTNAAVIKSVPIAAAMDKKTVSGPVAQSLPQNVLVRVGNWSMTSGEFKERLAAVKEAIPDFNPQDKEARKYVLDELVNQQLLIADAEKRGLGKNKDVVQAVEEFRRTMLVRELATQLSKEVQTSDQEAEEYYNQNKKEFIMPGEWHVREIVVGSEDEAKKILVDILQGADFAQTAQGRSKAPNAAQGGDLGFVSKFEFPQMEDMVKVLNPGAVSNVFQGPNGYYIVKLEEKKGGEQREFAGIKEEIKSGLLMLKQQQAVLGYVDKLRQSATIEINEKLVEESGL